MDQQITLIKERKFQHDLFIKNYIIYLHVCTYVYRLKYLGSLVQICDSYTFVGFHLGGNISDASIIDTLYELAIKIDQSMLVCKWRSEHTSCGELFRPILTEDGFCFTFNSLNSRDIYTDKYDHFKSVQSIIYSTPLRSI